MDDVILKVNNLSKQYRLGVIGTGTLSHDLNRWWNKLIGKADPFLKVGEENDRTSKGKSEYVWALKDINFEVKRGEIFGIIGKNGAGKSTLLKILSKVTGPTTGTVKTKGRIASLLEVGTGFHPEMTGRENIYLNGAILGMTKAEIASKIDEIIDFSGCERYIDTPVKRYSSGMKVRLAFAVAAHLEPEILVVDEVLAVGDANFQKKAIGKMQDISKGKGRTVLFVSHNMAAVQQLCTKAILIKKGRISFEGEVEEVIQEYLNESTTKHSLKDFKERSGSGVVTVVGAKIYGEKKGYNPIVGSVLNIDIELLNNYKKASSEIRLDLKIDDQLGQRIGWMSNSLFDVEKVSNVKEIRFKIKTLNLNSGKYYISTDMYVDGKRSDWLQNAIEFEVIEGNYYGSGKNVPVQEAKLLLDFTVDIVGD